MHPDPTAEYRAALSEAQIAAHDRQKDFPEALWTRLLDRVGDVLAPHARVVDAGVGSGVVATRMAARGYAVLGLDFNRSMLAAMRSELPCGLADVRDLPVRTSAVDGVVITNVLHLLADWRRAIDEAARILRPGGALLVALGGTGTSEVAMAIANQFRSHMPADDRSSTLGPSSSAEFEDAVVASGLVIADPIAEWETVQRTVGSTIERLQHNVFMWPPGTPRAPLDDAARRTRAWAISIHGSLDATFGLRAGVELRVARKP